MRIYSPNSPQAAARVVALTILADGGVSTGELASLVGPDTVRGLGLDDKAMQAVLEDLARDLYEFGAPVWDHSGGLHPLVIQCVLDDVTDPHVRVQTYQICHQVAESDSQLSSGELALLQLACSQWHLGATHHIVQKGTS